MAVVQPVELSKSPVWAGKTPRYGLSANKNTKKVRLELGCAMGGLSAWSTRDDLSNPRNMGRFSQKNGFFGHPHMFGWIPAPKNSEYWRWRRKVRSQMPSPFSLPIIHFRLRMFFFSTKQLLFVFGLLELQFAFCFGGEPGIDKGTGCLCWCAAKACWSAWCGKPWRLPTKRDGSADPRWIYSSCLEHWGI